MALTTLTKNPAFTNVRAMGRQYAPVCSMTIRTSPGSVRIRSTSDCSSNAVSSGLVSGNHTVFLGNINPHACNFFHLQVLLFNTPISPSRLFSLPIQLALLHERTISCVSTCVNRTLQRGTADSLHGRAQLAQTRHRLTDLPHCSLGNGRDSTLLCLRISLPKQL